jgi:hypothetical protein
MKLLSAATMFAFVLSASLAHGAMVRISVTTTDLAGEPVDSVASGDEFLINVTVQDIRRNDPQGGGVFGAALDLFFNEPMVTIDQNARLNWGLDFVSGRDPGEKSPGKLEGITAILGRLTPPGSTPQLFFQLPAMATGKGIATIQPQFDDELGHDVMLYGFSDAVIEAEIEFVGTDLRVVPEPSSFALFAMALIACGLTAVVARSPDRATSSTEGLRL